MALGRRFAAAGVRVLGYVGRNEASAQRACEFAGEGRPLALAELGAAHVVMFCVSDPSLRDAVSDAVAAAQPRSCSLWIHTSARFDLAVFEPLATKGVRIGALHPIAPFPDAESGASSLLGKPALLIADPRARRLLATLVDRLGMRAMWCLPGGDPLLYHAACALAANGLTALRAAVDAAFAHSNRLSAEDAAVAADALMRANLDLDQATKDLTTAVETGDVKWQDAKTTFDLWAAELAYVDELLSADVRNNSAWNQRYFVLQASADLNSPDLVASEIACALAPAITHAALRARAPEISLEIAPPRAAVLSAELVSPIVCVQIRSSKLRARRPTRRRGRT
jgi:predicted short-subunit dehydrogenase-like oxidoreductase (DUF2520 family)